MHLGQTCALIQKCVIESVLVVQGLCSGHEQALGKGSHSQPCLLLQAITLDVLRHQSRQARHLRGSHGGAGHGHILIRRFGLAIDRENVAAGGCNLRLQGQGAGNAPGAEGTHRGPIVPADNGLSAHLQRAGIIGHSTSGGRSHTRSLHCHTFVLGDGNTGGRVFVAL